MVMEDCGYVFAVVFLWLFIVELVNLFLTLLGEAPGD